MQDLTIIQKVYDLIVWYVPVLNKLPRDHKFALGDRLIGGLYDALETLIRARYVHDKLEILESANSRLEILRYQTRLLHDFRLMADNRYEFAGKALNEIGTALGGWIKHQRAKRHEARGPTVAGNR